MKKKPPIELFHQVRGSGPLDASIVVVAEAPAGQEVSEGRPLVGYSGQKWTEVLDDIGLRRCEMRIENVCERQAPQNKITKVPIAERRLWMADLRERAKSWTAPRIVVPMGNTALEALTGYKGKHNGITNWRGSVIPVELPDCKPFKVLPTFHPAYMLYDPTKEVVIRLDWKRIAQAVGQAEAGAPKRKVIVNPSSSVYKRFVDGLTAKTILSVDIETPGGKVWCVGFAYEIGRAIVIRADTPERRNKIRALLRHACPKLLQNGVYDAFYLLQEGYPLVNYAHDTMDMHHVLEPRMRHGLEFQASIYTEQPKWKDYSTAAAIQQTNGVDVCVTLEIALRHIKELKRRGQYEYYLLHHSDLLMPRVSMMLQGIPVNVGRMRRRRDKIIARVERMKGRVEHLLGYSLWGAKGGLSVKKVNDTLYKKFALPRQYNRKTKVRTEDGGLPLTSNEVAMRRLRMHAETAGNTLACKVLDCLLRLRKDLKRLDFVNPELVDTDDVMRCTYKNTTLTERFSSSENPRAKAKRKYKWEAAFGEDAEGTNLQNQDRKGRSHFIPTNAKLGWLFAEIDLSLAEDRIVRMLTRDKSQIERARRLPEQWDAHKENAALCLAKPESDVTKDDRNVGKIGNHAGNYDQGPETLSDTILKHLGIVVSIPDCAAILARKKTPPLLNWHAEVRRRLVSEGYMIDSWGWLVPFKDKKLDFKTYHEAYAQQPQGEIAKLLNQWGLKPAYKLLCGRQTAHAIVLNAQVHDSLLFSIAPRPELIHFLFDFMRSNLERPRVYYGQEMTIPITYKLGRNWGNMAEFKHMPSVSELATAIKEMKK